MDVTNFGQIAIYNEIFGEVSGLVPKYNPKECINYGKSYSLIYKKKEIPIMIGSILDIYPELNPLNLNGYFIVDGICKSINNIKVNHKYRYTKDRARLSDDSEIIIKNMFLIYRDNKKFKLPSNWEDIIKHCKYKNEITNFLEIIVDVIGIVSKRMKEIDIIILGYLFESWLDLRKVPYSYRIMTAGEIINMSYNPIKYMKSNTWKLNENTYNCISEDMKHNNKIGDIESIRKVTILKNRETVGIDSRITKNEDKYIVSPIHTPDGKLCGTVRYLCEGVFLKTKRKIKCGEKNRKYVFINGKYEENSNLEVDFEDGDISYIFNYHGEILKSKIQIGYTESFIPFRLHNPPIRTLFACSMIKQAITGGKNSEKTLINTKDIGFNLEVGIMCWYGYNIEDAIVISEEVVKKFKYKETKIYREYEKTIVGINVKKNQNIYEGQLLYRKYNPENVKTIEMIYSEIEGNVKEIIKTEKYLEIKIEKIRNLEVGDKMTSRHGQKSIISLILKQNEMPFYKKNGNKIHLELLINPHAFPTRMTMGQIKEMGEKLETVYINNNKKIKEQILVGKCMYLALKHQVHNKFQFRNKGRYDTINKQPIHGRKVKGGLRVGQMEREVLTAIGAEEIIKDLWKSDLININVCEKTGIINPQCCSKQIKSHQFFIMCLGYIRGLGMDILFHKNNEYSIVNKSPNLKETNTMNFGDLDPLDIRIYNNKIILPLCLRSEKLNKLYKNYDGNKIKKEIKYLLKSKSGVYHKFFEGHRIDRCIRSVIIPNPKLKIDEVEIPFGVNIETDYGILNRQPTLNINSLAMVKLITGPNKTIGINPLLCKSFNADFDGDEMNIYGTNYSHLMKPSPKPTQDYILGDLKSVTEKGLTPNRAGIIKMILEKSKGEKFNYDHIFIRIGELMVSGKVEKFIDGNYNEGIEEDDWYECCKAAIESASSISINTPITGYLSSICNQAYL